MDIVNTTASTIGIAAFFDLTFRMAVAVAEQIHNISDNSDRSRRLEKLIGDLTKKLSSAKTWSSQALALTYQQLESVKQSLTSTTQRRERPGLIGRIGRFTMASVDNAALVEAESKLGIIMTQVVVLDGMFQVVPTICNESSEPPESQVGLDRGADVLDFLRRSQPLDLRVIAIHGQAGVGKTTLLEHVWDKVARKDPFKARALVQIGHHATPETICRLQTDILKQLCGHNKEFVGTSFGREELDKSLKELKAKKKPLFLAIDNVFEIQVLKDLLPAKIRQSLPASSCIALTCRDSTIVETLLNICRLQKLDHLHVYVFEPPCLNREESRRLFSECAGMSQSAPEHQDLLNALVPLCGGLPLALKTLGGIFVDEKRREKDNWQLVQREMETFDGADDGDCSELVARALNLSFKRLGEPSRLAFLDIVSSFYGWDAERVERIVGKSVERLVKSSLVGKVDAIYKCNQNSLREGYDMHIDRSSSWYDYCTPPPKEFISMHDLTLKFGEKLIRESSSYKINRKSVLGYNQIVQSPLKNFPNGYTLRTVCLSTSPGSQYGQSVLDFLQSATNLQTLLVSSNSETEEPLIVRGSSCDSFEGRKLQYLSIVNCILSKSIMELKVSHEIKEIVLRGCDDIQELPNFRLLHLESLDISRCSDFQGFSASCVKDWGNLKYLTLRYVPKVTRLPMELGLLQSLRAICVVSCRGLIEFPSLRSPCGPSSLVLRDCDALGALGPISCPLQSLDLRKLPIKVFELAQVTALRRLSVEGCRELLELPADIVNASSLQSLSIKDCPRLLELLPDEKIGNLASLTDLIVRDCQNLQRLPAGLFQKLVVRNSSQQEKLLDSICSIPSLKKLDLTSCERLTEIPEQIGGLSSLEDLCLWGCPKLKELPVSICSITSLKRLELCWCESLTEIPEQIGGLSSLKKLRLRSCPKLKELPASICSITSLKRLGLCWCESLTEIPEQIGGLSSLEELWVRKCPKLKELPASICSITSLKRLELCWCESLTEIPEQIGGLSSLEELWVRKCPKLKELPASICSITSLKKLGLNGCQSLTEIPEQIKGLIRDF